MTIAKKSGITFSLLTSALCGAFLISGCSPGAFFGDQKDKGVQNLRNYRKVNTSCSGMNLSSSRLDLRTSRQLVACLDSNGALGDFAKLVQSMSDEELAPFVESLNRSFIENPGMLFKAEHILDDLKARGELDSVFSALGTLLEEDELIARSVAIFRKSYAPEGKIDPVLLGAAERLARELTTEHVADGLDLGLLVTEARALGSAWSHLKGEKLDPQIAEGLVAYGRSDARLGRELIDHVLDGSLFEFVDGVVPSDSDGIRAQAPRWSSVLEHSLVDQGRIAADLGRLFAALENPIVCMKGSRALRYTPMDVIGELTALPSSQARSFIARDKLTQLYMSYPLCSFPSQIAPGYRALVELADTAAVEPMADLLRSAYQINRGTKKPVADFFVRAMANPHFQDLLPALGELQKRSGWQDILLLSTVPQITDRTKITYALQVLTERLPSGTTIFDILVQGLTRVDPSELSEWLSSFGETRSGLASALRGIRAAYYVNDVHPLLDLVRAAMAEAPQDSALLEAMLKVSARPAFQGSIRELSHMAEDGRLKDLMTSTAALFDRYAAAHGQTLVHSLPPGAPLPERRFAPRHDWVAGDLNSWTLVQPLADFGACREIDFSVRWNDASNGAFESQLRAVSACINGDGGYSELAEALRLLAAEQTELTPAGPAPRSLHSLLVEAYNAFQFSPREAPILADWILGAVNDGRVDRALHVLPILIHQSVIRPVVDFAAPLIHDLSARSGLKRLGVYGSSVLERDDLQKIVAYVDDLFRLHPRARKALPRRPYDRARLARWISNKECSSLPADGSDPAVIQAAKDARINQLIDEFENSAVADGQRVDGKLRQSWTTAELKAELDPIFKKFADIPNNGPLARALLRFAARFNDPAQFPPGFLETWLRGRANDRRIVSYFYPGEDKPRVRMLNGLDVLSVMLTNADIDFLGDNIGKQFLIEIGDAWGDVPFEKRPAEIQAKFPQGGTRHCKTLAEAVAYIHTILYGSTQSILLPPIPKCNQVADPNDSADVQLAETSDPQVPPPSDDNPPFPEPDPGTPDFADRRNFEAHLFNISNTVFALEDNLKNGGLPILRDLFFDLTYTGPVSHQSSDAGIDNNLSVATYLVRVGLLRQVGKLMADTPEDDASIHGFFRMLIEGAAAPEMGPVAESLFGAQPDQDLMWNIIDQAVQLKSDQDIATAKAVGLNALSAIDTLGHARTADRNELIGPLLLSLQPILAQHSPLLSRHADLVGDLITWQNGADFLRALTRDRTPTRANVLNLVQDAVSDTQRGLDLMAMLGSLDSSPQAHQSWNDFRDRWKALDKLAEYRALHLDDIGRDLLNALEGRTANGAALPANQVALSRKLLLTVAELGKRGDMELVDQLLSLAARKPDDFYKLVESTSRLVENGEIPRLLELMRQKLGPI